MINLIPIAARVASITPRYICGYSNKKALTRRSCEIFSLLLVVSDVDLNIKVINFGHNMSYLVSFSIFHNLLISKILDKL